MLKIFFLILFLPLFFKKDKKKYLKRLLFNLPLILIFIFFFKMCFKYQPEDEISFSDLKIEVNKESVKEISLDGEELKVLINKESEISLELKSILFFNDESNLKEVELNIPFNKLNKKYVLDKDKMEYIYDFNIDFSEELRKSLKKDFMKKEGENKLNIEINIENIETEEMYIFLFEDIELFYYPKGYKKYIPFF